MTTIPRISSQRFNEDADEADIGVLVIQAADQLVFAGPKARASVNIAIDGQWFRCTLQMIDESEVRK